MAANRVTARCSRSRASRKCGMPSKSMGVTTVLRFGSITTRPSLERRARASRIGRPRQAEALAETDLVDGRPWRQFHPENFFAKIGVDARASRLLDGPDDLTLTLNSHSTGPLWRARGIYHDVSESRSTIASEFPREPVALCGTDASLPRRPPSRLEGSSHRRRRSTASGKKIEVDAFVRLSDMLDEQSLVASWQEFARTTATPSLTCLEFRIGDQQRQ